MSKHLDLSPSLTERLFVYAYQRGLHLKSGKVEWIALNDECFNRLFSKFILHEC